MSRRGLVTKTARGDAEPAKPVKPRLGGGAAGGRLGLVHKQDAQAEDSKPAPAPPPVLTLREVASRLRVPVSQVKDWMRQGLLRGSLAGIPPCELEKFCRVHRPDALAPRPTLTPKRQGGKPFLRLEWLRGLLARFMAPRPRPAPPPPPPPAPDPLPPPGPPTMAEVLAAVTARDPGRLKDLLEAYRQDVLEAVDESRNTALHWAVRAGGYERPYLLLAAGAEVNARNQEGATPLTLVLTERPGGWRQVADLLRERGGQE